MSEMIKSQSSAKIATNAKGEKSFEVKAYADTVESAVELAVKSDAEMARKLFGQR